jgi:integrase
MRPRKKCLEDDQVNRLLDVARASNPRIERLLLFLFNTGGRKTESFTLTWKEIDLFANGVCQVTFKRTKFGRSRSVPIPDGLRDLLRQMKNEQQDGGYSGNLAFAYRHPKSGNWLEPSNLDGQMALQAAAGFRITLHVCRILTPAACCAEGSPEEVSVVGAWDITTTHRIYAHLDQNNSTLRWSSILIATGLMPAAWLPSQLRFHCVDLPSTPIGGRSAGAPQQARSSRVLPAGTQATGVRYGKVLRE